MNQDRDEHLAGTPELPADEKPGVSRSTERGHGPDTFSPAGPLGFFLGDRYNVGHDRTFEWRDALGCLWLPGLVVILSIAIWLGQNGVPALPLEVGAVVAIVGLGIALWLIGKAPRGV